MKNQSLFYNIGWSVIPKPRVAVQQRTLGNEYPNDDHTLKGFHKGKTFSCLHSVGRIPTLSNAFGVST